MEDAHTHILSLPKDEGTAFFAVYDGHGGAKVNKGKGGRGEGDVTLVHSHANISAKLFAFFVYDVDLWSLLLRLLKKTIRRRKYRLVKIPYVQKHVQNVSVEGKEDDDDNRRVERREGRRHGMDEGEIEEMVDDYRCHSTQAPIYTTQSIVRQHTVSGRGERGVGYGREGREHPLNELKVRISKMHFDPDSWRLMNR